MAEAGGLQHVMEQLRDLVPLIPARVEEVTQKGSDLRKAAETVVQDYKEVQSEGEALFRGIESELGGLREEADRYLAEFGTEMEQVQQGIESLKALDAARSELVQGVEQAGLSMGSFQKILQEGIEEVKHAGDELKVGLDQVHQMTDQGHQMMNTGLTAAHDAANKLQHALKDGSDKLEHLVDTYGQKIKDHEQKLHDKVEEYTNQAKQLHQEFEGHVDDILKNVVQKGADDAIDGLKEHIETGLKSLVDEAVKDVTDAIEHMVEAVTGTKQHSEEGRGQLEGLFKSLEDQIQPVKTIIDAVKSVAESLGIDF